jgi:hypothetical protein
VEAIQQTHHAAEGVTWAAGESASWLATIEEASPKEALEPVRSGTNFSSSTQEELL